MSNLDTIQQNFMEQYGEEANTLGSAKHTPRNKARKSTIEQALSPDQIQKQEYNNKFHQLKISRGDFGNRISSEQRLRTKSRKSQSSNRNYSRSSNRRSVSSKKSSPDKKLFRKPITVSSEFSLNNQNTQKLWLNFEKSLKDSALGGTKTSPIRKKLLSGIKWSPSKKQQQIQDSIRSQGKVTSAANLFQQGVDEALKKTLYGQKKKKYVLGPTLRELSPENIIGERKQKETGNLKEYFQSKSPIREETTTSPEKEPIRDTPEEPEDEDSKAALILSNKLLGVESKQVTFRTGFQPLLSSPPAIKIQNQQWSDDLIPKMPDLQEERDKIKILPLPRKKSPADLVDTVNRKYKALFGGQDDLVNLMPSQDTSIMDIEDFMRYLQGNEQKKLKSLPLRNPSPQRLKYIESIKTQAEVNRQKKFKISPKRKRSRSKSYKSFQERRVSMDAKKQVRFRLDRSSSNLKKSQQKIVEKSVEKVKIEEKNKDCQKMLIDMVKDVKKQQAAPKPKKEDYSPYHFADQSKIKDFKKPINLQKNENIQARILALHKYLRPLILTKDLEPAAVSIEKTELSDLEKKQIYDRIHNLILCEKLLQSLDFDLLTTDIDIVETRLLNAFMLMKLYTKAEAPDRVIRFLTENTKSNLYIKDLLEKVSHEANLSNNNIQNYVLYIQQYLGDAYMDTGGYQKASGVYYMVQKIYNRWKVNNPLLSSSNSEFGVDDYIRIKSRYAESIMNIGDLPSAIDKFENAKQSIENEIVYEHPMLFVNICNQLGNCYLQQKNIKRALENFEGSLVLINKIENEKLFEKKSTQKINPLVIAKICMNIALIRSQMGYYEEAVFMHQRSLQYKSSMLPQLSDEIRDQNILLAYAHQRIGQHEEATKILERAFQIQKSHNGEFNYKSAQLMGQLAASKLREIGNRQNAINDYEYACMILSRIENKPKQDKQKIVVKLDKFYIQLIDLYLQTNQQENFQQILNLVESRLTSDIAEYSYRMMNEIANILRKHEKYDLAQIYYKKALLCMKRRHKNQYLENWETAKILINVATVFYMQKNFPESLKYHHHSIEVLQRVLTKLQEQKEMSEVTEGLDILMQDTISEISKVHMSTANLFRLIGEKQEARNQYLSAIDYLELLGEAKLNQEFENVVRGEFDVNTQVVTYAQLMLEARSNLKNL